MKAVSSRVIRPDLLHSFLPFSCLVFIDSMPRGDALCSL
jgi:hypothetical protein